MAGKGHEYAGKLFLSGIFCVCACQEYVAFSAYRNPRREFHRQYTRATERDPVVRSPATGLTQAEAAVRIGVGPPRISPLESTRIESLPLSRLRDLTALYGLERCIRTKGGREAAEVEWQAMGCQSHTRALSIWPVERDGRDRRVECVPDVGGLQANGSPPAAYCCMSGASRSRQIALHCWPPRLVERNVMTVPATIRYEKCAISSVPLRCACPSTCTSHSSGDGEPDGCVT